MSLTGVRTTLPSIARARSKSRFWPERMTDNTVRKWLAGLRIRRRTATQHEKERIIETALLDLSKLRSGKTKPTEVGGEAFSMVLQLGVLWDIDVSRILKKCENFKWTKLTFYCLLEHHASRGDHKIVKKLIARSDYSNSAILHHAVIKGYSKPKNTLHAILYLKKLSNTANLTPVAFYHAINSCSTYSDAKAVFLMCLASVCKPKPYLLVPLCNLISKERLKGEGVWLYNTSKLHGIRVVNFYKESFYKTWFGFKSFAVSAFLESGPRATVGEKVEMLKLITSDSTTTGRDVYRFVKTHGRSCTNTTPEFFKVFWAYIVERLVSPHSYAVYAEAVSLLPSPTPSYLIPFLLQAAGAVGDQTLLPTLLPRLTDSQKKQPEYLLYEQAVDFHSGRTPVSETPVPTVSNKMVRMLRKELLG
eukprot:TRINITY_DN12286_c0_g4_i1.p1 TRINITY_DN12286_c0_g4~~TRINITY_DN12286_c0_g4_i1.p1  ORF type:complete len:419 (+),score=39.23 TRINITY_DN12286_c0_g4_i1:48-1304(+)